jgi:predicted RNA-binding Zn ribbon-like protein
MVMATPPTDKAQVPFNLCGGHPALDFVNSLDDRFAVGNAKELLPDYDALLRFTAQAGLLRQSQARELSGTVTAAAGGRVVRSARELREAMAAVLYAAAEQRVPRGVELELLERRLHEAESPRQLHWQSANSLRWDWHEEQVSAAAFPLWLLAQSFSQLMASGGLERVRACEADSCRWLFLDTSKNRSRRWCDMKVCGNRAKARRFQERRAE